MTSAASSTPAALPELPNRLFSGGRSVLSRYGYRPVAPGEVREDWAEMWGPAARRLSGRRTAVPAYADLTADARAAAREYMARRLIADRNLEVCERWHVRLFSEGVRTDAVERYADARDAYEHSVEAFGAAREALEALLRAARAA